ncbi:MAG: hypothetical protein EBZ77_03405, partial [Chitinophagia bacterium]|nr:hypothetical protein [Chitinophagia bacterium]
MTKLYTAFLFFFLAFPSLALAQSPPGENEVLNYRLIGFTVPAGWAGNDTRIQIATGRYADEKLFIPNIVREKEIHGQRTLIEVPYFGRTYTWRLVKGSGKNAKTSDWHHFATGMSEHADTGRMRLRITAASQLKNPFYVFSDWSKTLYDASGNPVWYLPNIPGAIGENTLVRDLKVSPFGTITFMGGDNIYEIDWNGRILWQGPGNNNAATDGLGIYHHEFTRLANGHYMVLTNETICCNGTEIFKMLESVLPRNEYNRQLGYALHPTRQPSDKCDLYGNVVEYDEKGIIVWQWRSHPYLQQLYGKHLKDEAFSMDAHVNSFCFDASRKLLYVSLRNCNEILKIAYPSGKVVGRYGSGCMGGSGDTLFSGQHALSTLPDGSLLVFDNNTRLPGVHPRAIVMRD